MFKKTNEKYKSVGLEFLVPKNLYYLEIKIHPGRATEYRETHIYDVTQLELKEEEFIR